ncbi:MAG: hypothetical protein E6K19_07245 [Methanobacteriota archaeon]|nr:MAG: hypothetical protein E6K19_07245 [Euryarchaeota archaeon]
MDAAAAMKGPVYCRFSRANVPTVTMPEDGFKIGAAQTLRDGSDVTLVGCGLMVARCLDAAEVLARERIHARVINLATVKPLDRATIDRAARETGGIVTAEEHTTVHGIGAAQTLRGGSDVTLVGCGLMVARCLDAADVLARERIRARVINLATVKPLDRATIDRAARETGGIVTAEEHTTVHGIGAAIASEVAANDPIPVAMVGVGDVFGESGEAEELLEKYGLTVDKIVEAAHDVMKRRGRRV